MLIPVILSGGAGTRLWPVSRELHPKPFIRMADGESLLQKTITRIAALPAIREVLTVTNRELYFKTKDEYSALSSVALNHRYLLEPVGRNTAPAIAMAAFYILETYGSEAVLLVLPADHLIDDTASFSIAVQQAYDAAYDNKLLTFGVTPSRPETGFGYIRHAQRTEDTHAYYDVDAFIEKPSLVDAEAYIASGAYLWNAGMFCFKATVFLDQLQALSPQVFADAQRCWQISSEQRSFADTIEIDKTTFDRIESISIDYAVMEKATNVAVIPARFSWSDIGSWNAISSLIEPDVAGNRVIGDAVLLNVEDSFVQSDTRLVAAIGLKNVIIVDTPDALLLADSEHVQDVREIVSQLKATNHDAYKSHRTVFRPWGAYTILEEHPRFKIKRIAVKPGAALSLQLHHHRSEHWVVISGAANVTKGEEAYFLCSNESIYIPAGTMHRLHNPGMVDLILIEVQVGEYLGEDDIVRFDDQYGRSSNSSATLKRDFTSRTVTRLPFKEKHHETDTTGS